MFVGQAKGQDEDCELDEDGVDEVLIWLDEDDGTLLEEDDCELQDELEEVGSADDVLDWDAEDVLLIELDVVRD